MSDQIEISGPPDVVERVLRWLYGDDAMETYGEYKARAEAETIKRRSADNAFDREWGDSW